MSARTTKAFLISGALLLFVLLFIAPKIAPHQTSEPVSGSNIKEMTQATLDVYLKQALKNMEPAKKTAFDKLLANEKSDSVIVFWDKLRRPDLASFYAEEIAKQTNNAQSWANAGNRYYYSVPFCEDKTEVPALYQSAMRCFSKSLSLDPKNADTKIMLASCYVEGSQDPMEGIKRLRDIEQTDSNNVKLQLAFAFFSVKSGQLDKAINRFSKVLQIDSNYIEAYLHLADAYEQRNETEKTIRALEKYASKTTDVTAKIEVNKYIQQLKLNTNH